MIGTLVEASFNISRKRRRTGISLELIVRSKEMFSLRSEGVDVMFGA